MIKVLLNRLLDACKLNWTKGWGIFFQEEKHVLLFYCSMVWLANKIVLGGSLLIMLPLCGCVVLFRRFLAGGICISNKRLDGKIIVITGANTGIGKATAKDLAKRGGKIYMACRDTRKGQNAAEELRTETGGQCTVLKLDLSSLRSVRQFAENFKQHESKIDILINNAGIMHCPYWETEDGFEMQMGTNHLGHFLLTNLLLPLLKHDGSARIVTVSSAAHFSGSAPLDTFKYPNGVGYKSGRAYGDSKLANVLFTLELAKRLKGTNIQVFSLHPGMIHTELWRHLSWFGTCMYFFRIWKSPLEGAQTTLYCALEAKQEPNHFFSDCSLGYVKADACDDKAAEKLWTDSEKLVGLTK